MISDYIALTAIISGCAQLYTDSPIVSGVWLGLFVAAVVVSAIDEDITAALEPSQREAL